MNTETIESILNIFSEFRMAPTTIDQYDTVGKQKLAERLSTFVSNNQVIKFSMLGYPMKSPNYRDKVLGLIPDMAEEVSLQNFARFGNLIKEVYAPGVDIAIVSDGYVFSDILDTPDRVVYEYNEMAQDMAKESPITWFQMQDFYSRELSNNVMREKLMNQWGITEAELSRRILEDMDVNTLYKGMIKFLSLDLAIKPFPSNAQLHKAAKLLAREMMFRNEAYSRLVQSEFSDRIRLSMHPSVNNGVKYSFQLIPSKRAWTSPWHCALMLDNGEMVTIHRKEAEAMGAELVFKNGQPYYFVSKS